jgi:hypothetical protein
MNATVNETLNTTINETMLRSTDVALVTQSFVALIFVRLWELIIGPFMHPEMFWIILPLIFTLVVMEFYFDRHQDEELGWAAAVANSLVLIIVALDLLKHSFHYAPPWTVFKEIVLAALTDATLPLAPQVLLLIMFLGVLGVVITIINYYHLMPRKLAFIMSNHPPINFLAYFAIVIVYSTGTEHEIPFDLPTLIAGAILFVLILAVVFSIKLLFRRLTGTRNY